MQSDDLLYEKYEKERLQRFEGICKRCGECCGSRDGDPCANLAEDEAAGRYYCRSYEDRLGPQETVGGRIFNCISIRDAIKQNQLRANCAYNSITSKTNAVELKALECTKSR